MENIRMRRMDMGENYKRYYGSIRRILSMKILITACAKPRRFMFCSCA
ncbi:MAG: hypothetical protein L6V93_09470 [Clostridiales bacterium]|nr:MAG: hypothetical protein L6V93_09470 [Clostridiales bacterium]